MGTTIREALRLFDPIGMPVLQTRRVAGAGNGELQSVQRVESADDDRSTQDGLHGNPLLTNVVRSCKATRERGRVVGSRATLLVLQGIDQGNRFELDGDAPTLGVGRGVQNAVRLQDTEVSRSHARLEQAEGRWQLTDLNSSNGTFVNGQPIRSRDLRNGDQIQFGRTVMLFAVEAPAETSPAARDQVALVGESDPAGRSSIVSAQESLTAGELRPEDPAAPSGRGRTGGTKPRPDERISQTVANLQLLYRITEETVRPTNSLEELLRRILALVLDVCGADRGCILLRDGETDELTPVAIRFRRDLEATGRMPIPRSIVDYVLSSQQGVRTSDAQRETRFTPGESVFQAGVREAICVPMQGRYELLGALYVDITTTGDQVVIEGGRGPRFSEDLLRLMVAIGRQAALSVEDNRYRQALVKSERLAAVGQTIAILSHHIKNILQGVRGGSYLIDLGLKQHSEDMVRKGWGIVERNQDKIYHLVMDLLSLGKERQPALRKDNLNQTVAEVVELMQARAGELEATLEFEPQADLGDTTYDAEGIHRAVLNIVTNALDAVEDQLDRRVRVSTRFDEQSRLYQVIVDDTGPGIPPDRIKSLFNLFESTKGSRGTGIGLAVSRKIIREHGGDILVESAPGQGARFILEWAVLGEESPPLGGATVPGSIVVLDD